MSTVSAVEVSREPPTMLERVKISTGRRTWLVLSLFIFMLLHQGV